VSTPEQRKSRRFELKLPVEVVKAGSRRTSRSGETRNLSSAGVLFTAEVPMELGASLEYLITLSGNGLPPVRVRCVGKVVRLERDAVAATLERYTFIR
jgi:hypothetical protein